MGPNGNLKISRELMERMNRHSETPVGGVTGLGSGSRSLIGDHKLNKVGRRHVGSYSQSKLGQRTNSAVRSNYASSATSRSVAPSNPRVTSAVRPQIGFREPPSVKL